MNDDILKSVSQGSNGAYDEENRRIREISDELQRLCRLHEEGAKGSGTFAPWIVKLLDKVLLHNLIFPNTAYILHGFAGYDKRSVMPVLMQRRIRNAQPATQIMIDTYMSALGFSKENDEGRYSNGTYVVWDVVPRNVLVDADGDMYVVDAEIKKL